MYLLKFHSRETGKGFTLIELIVVMTLMTTLTAFAVPKIRSSLFANQLRSTARQFIGLIAETGQQARSHRVPVVLCYDRKDHLFTTSPGSSIARDKTKSYSSVHVGDSVQVVDVVTAHAGKKDTGNLAIRFSRRGYVDKTVVHFRDDNGDEISVFLSPFLGVTRVMEGYVSLDEDTITAAGQ